MLGRQKQFDCPWLQPSCPCPPSDRLAAVCFGAAAAGCLLETVSWLSPIGHLETSQHNVVFAMVFSGALYGFDAQVVAGAVSHLTPQESGGRERWYSMGLFNLRSFPPLFVLDVHTLHCR